MNLEVHQTNSHGKPHSAPSLVHVIDGVVELLKVPVHKRRGFTQNDANFL